MRQVVTRRKLGIWDMPAAGVLSAGSPDTYAERMLKYVPVETVVVWIAVFGSMSAVAYDTEFFPVFARWALILGAIGTVAYLWHHERVHDGVQLAVSTIGFVVWVHALAVLPFTAFPWYNPVAGACLLPVYTALVPLVDGIPGEGGGGGGP